MSLRNRIFQVVYRVLSSGVQCSAGNVLLGRGTGAGFAQEITLGSGLTITGGALTVSGVTPSVHAASHATGQADAISAASIGAAAASHTHLSSGITDATHDITDPQNWSKLLKGSGGAIVINQLTALSSINIGAEDSFSGAIYLGNILGAGVTITGPTGVTNRAVAFPDKDGTVAMLSDISLANTRAALGIPSYANLSAANAALTIGRVYYDETLETLNTATA